MRPSVDALTGRFLLRGGQSFLFSAYFFRGLFAIIEPTRILLFGGENMAGNEKSGRNPTFHLSEKELEEKINRYKKDLNNGEFPV